MPPSTAALVDRHLRFGWWSLLVFLSLGAALETMHGFKLGFYVDVANTTRRELWTLAHAHGTLLALIHLAWAGALGWRDEALAPAARPVSACLQAAALLIPGGFFLGGAWPAGGDPGLGILLVPLGALLLAVAVARTAWALTRRSSCGP
jgi:hypothetical protein